jgi:hypothetical protein
MSRIVLMWVVIVIVASAPANADKRPYPTELSDLATVWVGEGRVWSPEFVRLELDTRGEGSFVVQFLPGEPPIGYRVRRTFLTSGNVEFELSPYADSDTQIVARGKASRNALVLDVAVARGSWRRRLWLRRYDELLDRLEAVNRRAAELSRADAR